MSVQYPPQPTITPHFSEEGLRQAFASDWQALSRYIQQRVHDKAFAHAYSDTLTGTGTLTASGFWAPVIFDAVWNVAPGNSPNPENMITPPTNNIYVATGEEGFYLITVWVKWEASDLGTYRGLRISNSFGAPFVYAQEYFAKVPGVFADQNSMSFVVPGFVGSYFNIEAIQNTGGNLTITDNRIVVYKLN